MKKCGEENQNLKHVYAFLLNCQTLMFILAKKSNSGVVVLQLQCSVASTRTNFVESNTVKNQHSTHQREEEGCFSCKNSYS